MGMWVAAFIGAGKDESIAIGNRGCLKEKTFIILLLRLSTNKIKI